MGLLTNRYAIGALIFITSLCGAAWLSYDYGTTKVQLEWQAERSEINSQTILSLNKLKEKNQILSDNIAGLNIIIEGKSKVVDVVTTEVNKEVIKYVKEYIKGDCNSIDPKWVRIRNQSTARTDEFAEPTHIDVMSKDGVD